MVGDLLSLSPSRKLGLFFIFPMLDLFPVPLHVLDCVVHADRAPGFLCRDPVHVLAVVVHLSAPLTEASASRHGGRARFGAGSFHRRTGCRTIVLRCPKLSSICFFSNSTRAALFLWGTF